MWTLFFFFPVYLPTSAALARLTDAAFQASCGAMPEAVSCDSLSDAASTNLLGDGIKTRH